MPTTDPRVLNERYNDRFRHADLEGLVALYEPDAVLCPASGQAFNGHDEIREQLRQLLALQGTLSATGQSCTEFENLALLHAHWQFTGKRSDGEPVEMGGLSTKLARKGPDGNWRYVLDVPHAGAALAVRRFTPADTDSQLHRDAGIRSHGTRHDRASAARAGA